MAALSFLSTEGFLGTSLRTLSLAAERLPEVTNGHALNGTTAIGKRALEYGQLPLDGIGSFSLCGRNTHF
jgi:hypothetical protein